MRYVRLVSVLAMFVLALAACGDDSGDSDEASDNSETTESQEPSTDNTTDSTDVDVANDALLGIDDLPAGWIDRQSGGREFVDLVAEIPECDAYVEARVPPDESATASFGTDESTMSQWVDVYTDVEDAEETVAAFTDADNDMVGCLESLFQGEGVQAVGEEFDVEGTDESLGVQVELEDPTGDTGTFYLVVMRDDRVVDQLNIGLVSESDRDEIIAAATEKLSAALGD